MTDKIKELIEKKTMGIKAPNSSSDNFNSIHAHGYLLSMYSILKDLELINNHEYLELMHNVEKLVEELI